MTPHELQPLMPQLESAAAILGWERFEVTQEHERESNCSWTVRGWRNQDGRTIIYDDDLTLALIEEICRFAILARRIREATP